MQRTGGETHQQPQQRSKTTRSKKADRATQPRQPTRRTADQPKHTRTNTDRRTTTQHTRATTHTTHQEQHPTHNETRTTQTTHHQKPGNTTPQGTATAKAIKNTQLPQKKHETTHRRTEKHQVQPHRRCKCDTHNSTGGTTQRDTAPKAGRGHTTTQTTANKLQNTQKKHRKSNDEANFRT